MEHSFKRRRLSWKLAGSAGIHRFIRDVPVTGDKESIRGPASSGVSPSPRLFSEDNSHASKKLAVEENSLSSLHPRNLVPSNVEETVKPPSKTVVASVVQVVVNDGSGSEVTQLLVPASSKVVSVQGFAPITLGKAPPAASEAPLAASARNSYHQQPSATQGAAPNAISTDTTALASPSAASSPNSQPTSGGVYGNPNSLSINVPGSSQVVLSSPPSTPLPSSPASTSSSSAPGSYFSSSAPGSSAQSSSASNAPAPSASASNTAQPSPASQISNSPTVSAPSISNSTSAISSFTQSGAQTTSAEPSTVPPVFSSFNPNSTLVTSTRSRSSFASSTSLTSSGASSRTSSSLISSASTSTSSRTSSSSSAASSTQLLSSSSSSSASSTGGIIGGIGGPSGTASAPTSSVSLGAGSGGGNSVNTPAVVGGVVGGLAGLAVILLLLLFLLRWRRGKMMQRRTISPPIPQSLPPGVASTAPTTQRSSVVPFAAGGFFRRMRPGSGQTAETTETTGSERGFQNLGGRKLESVLSSRGDGYSDPVPLSGVAPRGYGGTAAGLGLAAGVASPASRRQGLSSGPSDNETLSGSSFYRDSQGFYGGNEGAAGPSSPPPTSPTSAEGSPPGDGFAVTRPGPARTPVINEPGFAPLRSPPIGRDTPPPGTGRGTPPPRNLTPQLRQQDEVGRSHPSFDGSRGSRFSEAV